MRSGPDVVKLSEEDVVTVLHTAETTNTQLNEYNYKPTHCNTFT